MFLTDQNTRGTRKFDTPAPESNMRETSPETCASCAATLTMDSNENIYIHASDLPVDAEPAALPVDAEPSGADLAPADKPEIVPAPTPTEPHGFDEFMAAFPKRPDGAGNRTEARKGYKRAIEAGASPARLTAAAKAYADERRAKIARDRNQSAFTLTAQRWFERDLWRSALIAMPSASAGELVHINRDSPLWPILSARYRLERGLPSTPTDRSGGWRFPRDWVQDAQAEPVAA